MSLAKHSQMMFIVLFMMYVGILQADILTNTFHKDVDCVAASGAPAFDREVKSTSRIHCLIQCSKIFECDSVIYQSASKTCLFYGANQGTICPSTHGRVFDLYRKNAVVTYGSVTTDTSISSDSPTTSYGTIGSTKLFVEETSQTTDISTSSSTQSTSSASTISSLTTHDPSCVNGNIDNGRSQCICNEGFMGTHCQDRFTSCTDWANYLNSLNGGVSSIGFYPTYLSLDSRQTVTIQPPNSPQPFSVQCKVSRLSLKVKVDTYIYINTKKVSNTFDKSWSQMKEGFNFNGDGFWIGLDHLYELFTNEWFSKKGRLRVLWEKANSNDEKKMTLYYDDLQIGNETTNYQLSYRPYTATTWNPDFILYSFWFPDLNGAMFSANDKDNDGVSNLNCAILNKRAFWYNGECNFFSDIWILTEIKIRKYWPWI